MQWMVSDFGRGPAELLIENGRGSNDRVRFGDSPDEWRHIHSFRALPSGRVVVSVSDPPANEIYRQRYFVSAPGPAAPWKLVQELWVPKNGDQEVQSQAPLQHAYLDNFLRRCRRSKLIVVKNIGTERMEILREMDAGSAAVQALDHVVPRGAAVFSLPDSRIAVVPADHVEEAEAETRPGSGRFALAPWLAGPPNQFSPVREFGTLPWDFGASDDGWRWQDGWNSVAEPPEPAGMESAARGVVADYV